jgi:haloacetate dehalogenase
MLGFPYCGAVAVWREWADDVRGAPVDAGHFLPEEAPDEVVDHLLSFLAGSGG